MKTIRLKECKGIEIRYGHTVTPYGKALVAATTQGLCYMGFDTDISGIESRFKGAVFIEGLPEMVDYETLVLKGTDFQVQVWEELLNIPQGKTMSYGQLAQKIGRPKAQRAVGSAVGSNPISIIIPCHRVLGAAGKIGGFLWGTEMKIEILKAENAI